MMRRLVRGHAGEKVMVMGDMKGYAGVLGERMNTNGELLDEFVDEINLGNLNVKIAERCMTWSVWEHESAIDYVSVNGRMLEYILNVNRCGRDD